MSFDDPRYPCFLALVAIAIGLLPAGRLRMALVLVASAFFYVLLERYWAILLVVGTIAYAGGLLLARLREGHSRFIAFVGILSFAILPLLFFKYAPTLAGMAHGQGDQEFWSTWRNLILPIGLSFYTFMALGYLIDIYIGNCEAESDPLRFATFISFFPQITAGPIERASSFLPQLDQLGQFDSGRVIDGLRAILLGAFMKIVIADSLAPHVNVVYAEPSAFGARDLALATIYFSFQVYGDFAGYSLMAIGSARLLGIELMTNFQQPYLSQTLPEYWRRWHISLSSWFRDYVFIPLQFRVRRSGSLGLAAALVFTFTLVGIWHGAGLKYAIFGLIHGILVAYSTLTLSRRDKLWKRTGVPKLLRHAFRAFVTFSIISLTFVLFRAIDVASALQIYKKLFLLDAGARQLPVVFPFFGIGLLVAGDLIAAGGFSWSRLNVFARWSAYYVMTIAVVTAWLFREGGYKQGFIYYGF